METQTRKAGPNGPGGLATVAGMAHGTEVHWFGDDERADQLEAQMVSSSRLQQLLLRNAYTLEGLTDDEKRETEQLIEREPETEERRCGCGEKSVGDTGLCRGHARYALAVRR